jgi:hypothetical protein
VTTFLLEVYSPSSGTTRDAETVARAVAGQGGVRYLRSILIPQDETCFHLLEAASTKAVLAVAARAAIRFERVVEAKEICAEQSAPREEER